MFTWHDLLYLIALLIGVLLVVGNALGLSEFGAHPDAAEPALEPDADGGPHADDGLLESVRTGPRAALGAELHDQPACSAAAGSRSARSVARCSARTWGRGSVSLSPERWRSWVPSRSHGCSRATCRLSESYASRKADLLGLAGRVVVCGPDGDAIVAVVDDGGAEMRIRARIETGPSRAGARVAISGYDPARDLFLVLEASEHGSERLLMDKTTATKERERS